MPLQSTLQTSLRTASAQAGDGGDLGGIKRWGGTCSLRKQGTGAQWNTRDPQLAAKNSREMHGLGRKVMDGGRGGINYVNYELYLKEKNL